MKIRLLTPQRILVQAGTEVEVDEGNAMLLISIGAAESVETETEISEKPKRTRKKG